LNSHEIKTGKSLEERRFIALFFSFLAQIEGNEKANL
jgi:hypothetical protein